MHREKTAWTVVGVQKAVAEGGLGSGRGACCLGPRWANEQELLWLDGPTGEASQMLSVGPWFGLLAGLDLGQSLGLTCLVREWANNLQKKRLPMGLKLELN